MAVDEQKVEEAVGKVFGELGVAITGPLVVLGDRLGLWAAMAGAGPVTPNELAARSGTVERYVREWLRGVAVAGYVGYDPAGGTFTLSDEMALVIAGEDSPASLIGVFDGFIGLWNDLATIEGFFRAGGGMGWGDHHPALNDSQARFTRPLYRAALVDGWIAALDGGDRPAPGGRPGGRHRLRPGHVDDLDGRTIPGLGVHRLRSQRCAHRHRPQGGGRRGRERLGELRGG